jgi:hypothetical protein
VKKTLIALSAVTALGLAACSSTNPTASNGGITAPSDATVAVKDQTISTDFTDQGIKIYYTTFGSLDRIEITGHAPVWKGNHTVIAEADAMDKLVKFVHGQNVTSSRRVQIMSNVLDRARDNTLNSFKTADGSIAITDKEAENLPADTGEGKEQRENTAHRLADKVDRTLVNTVNTITSSGRLTAVYKTRDSVSSDGKMYFAVYTWSEKDQKSAEFIRNRMAASMK